MREKIESIEVFKAEDKKEFNMKVDKTKLCNDIYNLKRSRDEIVKPIIEEYQVKIDKAIFKEIPFQYGDIITDTIIDQIRYFIYKGIKNEYMVLYGCDKNGIENNNDKQYHWTVYDEFKIYKKAV